MRDAEVLADKIGQSLARHNPHAGIHLLHGQQGNERWEQSPEQLISIVRSGNGVRGDSASVIIDAARNDARPEHAQENEQVAERRLLFHPLYQAHLIPQLPVLLRGRPRRACHAMRDDPLELVVVINNRNRLELVLEEQLRHSLDAGIQSALRRCSPA